MKRALWAVTALMAALVVGQSASTVLAEEIIKDIPYIDDGEQVHLLDVHGFEEDSEEKKPVIVEVHGGSYIGGVKEINTKHSEFYADHGYAVVNTNYTTMKGTGFDRVVQDLTEVLHWVEENADTYHFDLDHVFMSGDSAGGFFVTLMANVLSQEDLQEYYQITPPSYTVERYVLTCPGENIRAIADQLGGEGMSAHIAKTMGEDVIGNPDVVDHADTYAILDPAVFPEVYILTTPDDEILYEETKAFHEYLEENGVAHEYHEYVSEENQLEHVFNIGHTDWKESIQANEDIVAYLDSVAGKTSEETSEETSGVLEEEKAADASKEEDGTIALKTCEAQPEDEDYYAQLWATQMYNFRVLRDLPMAFEEEAYTSFLSSGNTLAKMDPENLKDAYKGVLDKLASLQEQLVQTMPKEEVMWPLWGDAMPSAEDPSTLVFGVESYDNEDFRPYMTPYLLENQEEVKGNLLVVAGGGFSSRNNRTEGWSIAEKFNALGYNCYVLQRRVAPYSGQDTFIDMARAIRLVRSKIEELGLGGGDLIFGAGFSGGSATVLGAVADYYGDTSFAGTDPSYVPDEIDAYSADLDAVISIYGPNYTSSEAGTFAGLVTDNENLPAFFIAAGMDDPTGAEMDNTVLVDSLRGKTTVEYHGFANNGHGFNSGKEGTTSTFWIDMADCFVTQCKEAKAKEAEKEAEKK